jgi:hypothetical protein
MDLDSVSVPVDFDDSYLSIEDDDSAYDDNYLEVVEVPDEAADLAPQFVFELSPVPGGEFQDDIEEPSEIEVSDEEIEVESDPWKWTVANFLSWLQDKMSAIPRHSGRDSAGLERAIAYLEQLDREISRAVRSDLNNEIAIDAVEKARDEIHKGLDRLHDRLDKVMNAKYPKRKGKGKKKKAEHEDGMVKEASKGAYYGRIVVTVPILISGIARACVNSMVSAGKDIEDEFHKLAKQYKLDNREEFMLYQALSDMGYHVRRPRGTELDEEVDYTSTENTGWIANYPG